jgi:HPt (histidine-containing phosphotransfer) domain-containing protein
MSHLFDETELLERIDNDWDFFSETVQMLAADAPGLLQQVRDAAARQNAAALTHAAHTLKGMISNFCAPVPQESAFIVEKIGRNGDLSNVAPAIEELAKQLSALIADLTQYASTRK